MKNGFTLIELLAVIVILAIIGLITTPKVLDMIEKSKEDKAIDSTYVYIEALEKQNIMAIFDKKYNLYLEGEYQVDKIKVQVKREQPTSGTLKINNKYEVIEALICMDGYLVKYKINEKTKTIGKC